MFKTQNTFICTEKRFFFDLHKKISFNVNIKVTYSGTQQDRGEELGLYKARTDNSSCFLFTYLLMYFGKWEISKF